MQSACVNLNIAFQFGFPKRRRAMQHHVSCLKHHTLHKFVVELGIFSIKKTVFNGSKSVCVTENVRKIFVGNYDKQALDK